MLITIEDKVYDMELIDDEDKSRHEKYIEETKFFGKKYGPKVYKTSIKGAFDGEKTKVGTTVIHLGKGDLDFIETVIPDKESLLKFKDLTTPIEEKIINNQFVEVIIAPGVSDAALAITKTKENVRVLNTQKLGSQPSGFKYLSVTGGLLVQETDNGIVTRSDLTVVSKRQPSNSEIENCLFAWKVCKFVKSNAIVYTKDNQTVGIGAGQMSRIDSAKIAASKAKERGFQTEGCSMASDAFFPFRDGIDAAAEIGISSVIQPGGSMRDEEVIQAANEADMAMLFTGIRHFRH